MRIDEDDDYIRPARRGRSGTEWVAIVAIGVVVGTLTADGLKLLAVNAWARYQLEQIAQAGREAQHRAEIENREAVRRQTEQQRQLAYENKFNSNECQFWRDINAQNPSNKSRQGLAEHCP